MLIFFEVADLPPREEEVIQARIREEAGEDMSRNWSEVPSAPWGRIWTELPNRWRRFKALVGRRAVAVRS